MAKCKKKNCQTWLPYFFTFKPSNFSVFEAKVWLIFSQEMGFGLQLRVWDSKQIELLNNFALPLVGTLSMMQK